jgi:hypothetical protein
VAKPGRKEENHEIREEKKKGVKCEKNKNRWGSYVGKNLLLNY